MRKSFKRALAAVLAVLMVVCAFPMTAMAAPGDYEPNIDLQFGTFFGLNYATWNDYPDFEDGDTTNKQDDWNGCNGIFGPALQYNQSAGTLTLTAASTEGYEDVWGMAPLDADYTYGVGDYFTVTVLLNNVDEVRVAEGYIKHSANIEPAGVWSTSGAARNRVYYVGTQAECDADGSASVEVHPAGVPIASMSAESFHDLNIEIGNNSQTDNAWTGDDVLFFSAVNQSGAESADLSTLNNDGTGYEFPNPITGEAPDYDNGDGYDYTNTCIVCTFAFKIVDDGAITFEVEDPYNTIHGAYSGFYYVANMTDTTQVSTFTTYAINTYKMTDEQIAAGETHPGSAKMTFMGKNVNVAEEECSHANTTTETVTAEATCDAAGSKTVTVTCADCGEVVSTTTVEIPALGHKHDAVVTAPTCTDAGYTTYTCSVCGDAYVGDEVAALGHTPAAAVVENEVAATCTTPGSYDNVVYCSVCGTEISRDTVTVPVIAHTPAAAVVENEVAASCGADGSYDNVVYCSVCGTEISRQTVTVPATGAHVYATEVDRKDATCTEDGYVTMACACGAEETTAIPALGHTEAQAVVENEVAATCTTPGSYDTVVYCSVCNEELSRVTTTVPVIAHTPVTDAAVAPTCTATGLTEGSHCSVCGTVLEAQEVVPALGHTPAAAVVENEVAADCDTDGSYDSVVYCSVCGAEISRDTVVVPALGHKYDAVVTAPTCTDAGYTTYTCSVCGDTYKGDEVAALGHTAGAAVQENVVAATCGTDGSYDEVVYCSVCGEELSREAKVIAATGEHVYATEVDRKDATCTEDGYVVMACGCGAEQTTAIPALGHTEAEAVTENNVAATCTTDGSYDTVVYCSVCNEELSRETTTVPALGHTPADAVVENEVAATCTTPGSYDTVVYCSVCNEELSRETTEVPVIAHTPVTDAAVAPTCTDTGLTEGSHCSVCGTVLEAQEVVPALGHTAAEAVQENVVNATCGTDGSYDSVVYCSVCGVEISRQTVTVPATGEHVYATEVDRKDATCTEDGYVTMACGCGAEQTTAIPALGHTEAEAVTENEVAATCTTDGSYDTVVYCSVCNEELSRVTTTVPATGHTEVVVPGYAATVDATGLTDGVACSVCGTTIVAQEVIPMLDSVIVTVVEPDLGNVTGLAYGDNKLAYATAYTLTAEALDGAEFIGWAINGKIVSESETYTSIAVNDVTVEAMFAEADGADAITVTFLDKWGNVVATFNGAAADVQAQLAAGIPTASDIVGYTFAGWDMADADILALTTSATIWAQYEVKSDGYTVTTSAELTLPAGVANGAIPYDTSVTVYAEGATAWKIGDVVVAYGDTYTFYVGADVTVVPVFDAVTTAPSVTMIKVTETGTNAFQFLATRNVPEGYSLVNAGFVFGRDMTADELDLDNVGTTAASGYKVKVAYCSVNGADQFALNYRVSAGDACAKAFVVYKDAAGAVNVIYTDMYVG